MTQGNPTGKPIIKRPTDEATAAHSNLWQIYRFLHLLYVSFSSLAREKCFVSYSAETWMSFWSLWISRWQPITVILSVSVSSTLLTQLPVDGTLTRFNHLLTHSMMITHTHHKETGGWMQHCENTQSPLHSDTLTSSISHFSTSKMSCHRHSQLSVWTSHPDRQQIPKINLTQHICGV